MDLRDTILRSPPRQLARILDLASDKVEPLAASDLEEILRQQLAAPIRGGSDRPRPSPAAGEPEPLQQSTLVPRTLDELFRDPAPSLDELRLVKDFAKAHRYHAGAAMPAEVADVLYYACIAAGLRRCGRRISTLNDRALAAAFDWAGRQSWLGQSLRSLFKEAGECLA